MLQASPEAQTHMLSLWIPPLRFGIETPDVELAKFAASAGTKAELCSYTGSTSDEEKLPKRGWFINRSRQQVGHGKDSYEKAARALQRLDCMELGWLSAHLHGNFLSICSRQFGRLWVMNANFVLRQTADERSAAGAVSKIAWGTTTWHVLAGEEQLSVRWDAADDTVTFEVLSFSRPRHLVSLATYPYVVFQQKRFARDASRRMRQIASS